LDFDRLKILEHSLEAVIILELGRTPRVRTDKNPVQHVQIEDAGFGNGGEGEGNHIFSPASRVVCGPSEDIVKVGRAHVDVREDRVDAIGIVVIGGGGKLEGVCTG